MNNQTQTKEKVPFIHLHVHSEYSILDGAARLCSGKHFPLIEFCQANNMPAVAITDHGNMFCAFTFYNAAKATRDHASKEKPPVDPIIGCEFYTCADMHKRTSSERNHLVLLAKNNVGYRNLIKLDSLAYIDGFYYKPRIDLDLLRKHADGLVCLSGCISGKIPQLLLHKKYDEAKAYALELKSIFADGDFYIELQNHNLPEELAVLPLLKKLADEIGVKTVATNDAHYINKSDAEMQDVMMCINSGKRIDDENRLKFSTDEFYLKSAEEMQELFSWNPECLETPYEIYQKCRDVVIQKHDLFPPYTPDDGSSPADYLRKMAYEGIVERYGEMTTDLKERTDYELEVIISKGFAEYYLIVWDFINYAKKNSIPVGEGRGSGVGSIVAYAIGITNVDPIKYKLFFERFLNPERDSPPDFDIDFCYEKRNKVIEYVTQKYGSDRVCQILALGTLKAKAAIKDVARVYGMPLADVAKITKPIPNDPKINLAEVLGFDESYEKVIAAQQEEERIAKLSIAERNKIKEEQERLIEELKEKGEELPKKPEYSKLFCPDVRKIYFEDEEARKVIDMALKLEGFPRNLTKHAAGVVICKEVISDFVPLQKNGNDVTTQFQKDEVESLGLLKMDFLGLKTLTDIDKAKKYIKKNKGIDIVFDNKYDDPAVYELISSGQTDAVFQLESEGMKRFMRKLCPNSLEDIIAGVSLYRPGPMDSIDGYVEAKNNPDKVVYEDERLKPILENTYGTLVYQEQVMQIVQVMGGYSLGRADVLRRAMGKKKSAVMKAERDYFINGKAEVPEYTDSAGKFHKMEPAVDGAIKRGFTREVAESVFDKMQKFASYAFNKSHAAAYSVLTYQTAYLKRHYLLEFVAAVINNRITNADEIAKYLTYIIDTGHKILLPDINKSDAVFTVEGDDIRYGFNGIKSVGENISEAIVEERNSREGGKFKNFTDAMKAFAKIGGAKKVVGTLISAGAFDSFGHTRSSLLACYEDILGEKIQKQKTEITGQFSFDELLNLEEQEDIPVLAEIDEVPRLSAEKELLNIYISGHPLESYKEEYNKLSFNLSKVKDLLYGEEQDNDDDSVVSETGMTEKDVLVQEWLHKEVEIGGIIKDVKTFYTKNAKRLAIIQLEDMYGVIDVLFGEKAYENNIELFKKENIVLVKGKINTDKDGGLIVSGYSIVPWYKESKGDDKKVAVNTGYKLYLNVLSDEIYEDVKRILDLYSGDSEVVMKKDGKGQKYYKTVDITDTLLASLTDLLGDKCVVVREC